MMIYHHGDFAKPRSLSDDFASLLGLCWRNGVYGNFWYASVLRYSEEEANLINQTQKRKNKVRAGDNKVTLTTWHPCNQPLPSVLPPQWFRSRFYGLSYRLLKNRFVTPDDPAFLHAYFGVNPVSPKPSHLRSWQYGVRSRKSTIQAVNVFIGDLDVKDFGGDWDALEHYIKHDLLLPPTAIIFTGGGVQIYFGLRETFPVFENGKQSRKLLEQIDGLYKGWNDVHEKFDPGAKDLSRAFRCENTINGKEKYGPDFPTTRFELLDLSRLYNLYDFEKVIPVSVVMPKVVKRTKSATKSTKSASQSSSWQAPTFEFLPSFGSQRAKVDWHLQYFNHDAYGDWKLVGLALSGEPGGYEIWSDWSRLSTKFDESAQLGEWESIQKERKERIENGQTVAGFGLLVKKAREKGAPKVPVVGEEQPLYRPNDRVNFGEVRVCVGETLANLFVPDGESWALLNPKGAKDVFSVPKRKPLQGALMDHIGGGTRRVIMANGQRRTTKTCVVIQPSQMTRVMAIRATSTSHALDVQKQLASQGLTSFSYPLCPVFPFFSDEVAYNGQIDISLLYKDFSSSKNDDLGKMSNQGLYATFPNHSLDETENEHIVLVAFSECVPSQLLHTHTRHTQLDPYLLPFQLLSHYPPFCPAESKISLVTQEGEETFEIGRADEGFKAWDALLKRDIINDTTLLAGLQIESNQDIQNVRTRSSEITESLSSVMRWHNRRHVMLKTQTCGCGERLLAYDTGDGYQAGWCVVCRGQPVTHFAQEAHALRVSPDELATQIRLDNQLGQAGTYVIEHQPPMPKGVTAVDVDMNALIEAQKMLVTNTRERFKEDINQLVFSGEAKGKIFVVDMTAGGGKTTMMRELIVRWYLEYKLLSRITTDTKKLSYEWHEGFKPSIVSSFVFESLVDCCKCFPHEVIKQAIARNHPLKHNKACVYVTQMTELMRGSDRKQKRIAIFRHEHLRIKINGINLIDGIQVKKQDEEGQSEERKEFKDKKDVKVPDIYVSDEEIFSGLVEMGAATLPELQALLTTMQKYDCKQEEEAIISALVDVCGARRVAQYQHVDGSIIVQAVEERLKERGLEFKTCLEALKNTRFAKPPKRLEPDDFSNESDDTDEMPNLPRIWLPKFIVALEATINNPAHSSFFLEQASRDKRYSKLQLSWGIKHEYLPNCKGNGKLFSETYHFLLDATPNTLILEALFPGWDIEFLSYKIPPSPQHQIIQIDGINLTRKYLRNNLKPTVSKLAAILNDLGLLVDAIVTRKDIKEGLAGELGVDEDMVLNFRNQRGSNGLKNAEVLLVFGDATIPNNAALRMAHILWSHDPKPFEVYKNGAHFQRQGGRWIAKDERVQAVLDKVKAEAIQGIQRQRLINSDKQKTVVLVSNFDAVELIDGLEASRVKRIDAKRLHGNSRQVREALDIYHDRLIKSGRVKNTGVITDVEAESAELTESIIETDVPPMSFEADMGEMEFETDFELIETDMVPPSENLCG